MLDTLKRDFRIIFDRDPAARNWLEVLLCYPGLQAIVLHRFAHWLQGYGLPVIPRLISHLGRFFTGIEIHPGAQIGEGTFIDHGMGVVIGETAIVGRECLIYQGVTLGGTGKETGKRHPTLGNNVVVGAGAKVLGNIDIGDNVRIGAGSVVLRHVPPDCTVVGIPGRVVDRDGTKSAPLEHGRLPDSEAQAIRALLNRLESLEESVSTLQEQLDLERAIARSRLPVAVGCDSSGEPRSDSLAHRLREAALDGGDNLNQANRKPASGRPCEDLTLADWERIAAIAAQIRISADLVDSRQMNQHPSYGHLPQDSHVAHNHCQIKDRAIEAFLDGAGI